MQAATPAPEVYRPSEPSVAPVQISPQQARACENLIQSAEQALIAQGQAKMATATSPQEKNEIVAEIKHETQETVRVVDEVCPMPTKRSKGERAAAIFATVVGGFVQYSEKKPNERKEIRKDFKQAGKELEKGFRGFFRSFNQPKNQQSMQQSNPMAPDVD